MRKNHILIIALALLTAFAMTSCKSGGMAVTSRGQLLKININHPKDLPENGEDNLDIEISNRGVNNIENVLVDVELPSQLIVLDQTNGRGINVTHDPGSSVYHFTLGNIQPGESSNLRFRVRTAFGTMRETGSVKVTAWQRDLPGDRLVETAVIKLRM
ncbi:MAG TPA: hypothetical protein VJ276_19120 [Thermoanaerobaculia bacterium]|nr:hypothetical protein [Thermoanaerobaculia bacterium]